MKRVAIIVFFLCCAPSAFAQSWVQGATAPYVGSSPVTLAYGSNNTSGNLLFAVVQWTGSLTGPSPSCTDTLTDTWHLLGTAQQAGEEIAAFYTVAKSTGANTVNCSANVSSLIALIIGEYSGVDSLDQNPTPTVGYHTSTWTTPAVTTQYVKEVIIGWGGTPSTTLTGSPVNSPFTAREEIAYMASNYYAFADDIVSSIQTGLSATFNISGSSYALAGTATFFSSGNVGSPTKIVFTQQPTNTPQTIDISPAVTVTVEDANSQPVPSATNAVTVAIGTNPASGTLSGTLTRNASGGVATFADLNIDNYGTGYTLTASASGLTGATSNTFNILGTTLAIGQSDTAAMTSSNNQVWPGCSSSCMTVNPAYVVLPGSTRRIWTNVCTGTNVWGGTTGSPTCVQPASVAVTWAVNSGNCTMSPSPSTSFSTLTCPSSISATELDSITATTVQDNTVSQTIHVLVVKPAADVLANSASMAIHTCGTSGQSACVNVMPFYEVLYKNQYADLQAYVTGYVNTKVTWSVSPNNGGLTVQNGTSNRSLALLGVNAGTYTVTATSVADGTTAGTAKIIVTANDVTGQTRTSKVIPIDCTAEGSGTNYSVTDDTSFAAVPWSTLGPGDTVQITAKAALAGYAIPFQLSTSGTPTQPIRICGIPDGSGNLPILTGNGAGTGNVSSAQQAYGMVVLVNGPGFQHLQCTTATGCSQPPEPDPHSIIIEGLKINDAYSAYSRTGGANAWNTIASPIRIQARDVIIRGNDLSDCSMGLYTQSVETNLESRNVRRITVEGNYIYNNGEVGGSSNHNNYLQGEMLLFQWNWIGIVRSGALGSSVKIRMPYSVVRYNYIQGSERNLDLVEIQDWYDQAVPYYFYHDNWPSTNSTDTLSIADVAANIEHEQSEYVYGNVMDNNALNGIVPGFPIHYFGDVFGDREKGGIAYIYGNTDREIADHSGTYGNQTQLIDSTRIGPLPEVWPRTQLTNNAIDLECATALCANGHAYFSFDVAYQDTIALNKNWITAGWNSTPLGNGATSAWVGCCQSPSNNGSSCFQTTCDDTSNTNFITGESNLVTGATVPFNGTTFIPPNGSPLLLGTTSLPSAVSDMPPEFNYEPDNQAVSLRPDLSGGAPTTIGALGGTGSPPPSGSLIPSGVKIPLGTTVQ